MKTATLLAAISLTALLISLHTITNNPKNVSTTNKLIDTALLATILATTTLLVTITTT
jgi:hypothetical protein